LPAVEGPWERVEASGPQDLIKLLADNFVLLRTCDGSLVELAWLDDKGGGKHECVASLSLSKGVVFRSPMPPVPRAILRPGDVFAIGHPLRLRLVQPGWQKGLLALSKIESIWTQRHT
jgi:hypothetical protein